MLKTILVGSCFALALGPVTSPAKAFTPIAVLALFPNVLVANPQFPAANVRDVLAMAKASPGRIAFASSGNGSAQHLAGALFEDIGKVDMMHVPYRGGGPALNDVIAGQVPLFFANLASSLGQIQGNRLRALAVTSKRRSPALPDVPTVEEAGLAGYEVYEWNPILAPVGISADTRRQLVTAVQKAMAAPEVQERIRSLGGEAFVGDTEAAARFLQQQNELWARVVREHNIKAE
jgi:tripartite-type tricarboxylate transporter receptor subunit TctC